ncbi:pilus assembly protein PilM [Vibrio sp. WJH972]
MANTIVTGIDIGTQYITAAIVEMGLHKPKLLGVEHIELSGDIFAENKASVYQDSVKKLVKVRNMQPLFQHRVAFSIPDVMVMNKMITVDTRLPLEQQRLTAMHQFLSTSPLKGDELCFDYVPHPNAIEVYAARKHAVQQRVKLAKQIGMRPILIDTERQAFLQLLLVAKANNPQLCPVLIELKEQSLTFGALTNESIFYRHIPLDLVELSSCSISAQIEQQLELLRVENETAIFNEIWFIKGKEHDDLITNIVTKSNGYFDYYPLGLHFLVKRSLVAKSLEFAEKACGIALRGITSMEQRYAS